MTQTKLSDVVVPEVFNPPFIERTAEKIALYQSGIVTTPPEDEPISLAGSKTIEMPFYQDLSGEDNVWDDSDDITLNKIGMGQDTAVVLTREKAWGSTDLAKALSGDDPMNAIVDLTAGFWGRRYQAALLATVKGAMSVVTANILNISALSGAAAYLDGESFVDATQKLGDRSDALTTIAMHSATEAWLRKNDLITDVRDSEGKLIMRVFQGREVVIDDGMEVASGGVYSSYLFGPGAVTLVDAEFPEMSEPARHPEKAGGTDALYTRRKFVIHPRGVRWTPASGVPASATPSNTELANSANWTRVWEAKNIRIVKVVHKIG